jgi:transcriptional regulator with XRE-family HTH domain
MKLTQLSAVGVRLREERLRRGYTIEEVASGINVNRAVLEQIEKGILPGLPEPYIRGIIQAFARKVGVDLDQIPEHPSPVRPDPESLQALSPAPPPALERFISGRSGTADAGPGTGNIGAPETSRGYRRTLVAGLGMLTIMVLAIFIFWMSREKSAGPVQELSFNDAVKEQEEKYAAQLRRNDSAARMQDEAVQLARGDSLMLEGRATDSVLVTIAIDHATARQFHLAPQRAMEWRAEKSFVLTISNPAAAVFTLNGIRLSSLSRPDQPVKNVFLSRATIDKLQAKHN